MDGIARLGLVATAALLALAGCERPTGPELIDRIDRAERDLLADTSQRAVGLRLGASWDLITLLPNGRDDADLLADIDGTQHRLKAFVFERVVVRLDPGDGYPCPLMFRELMAVEGVQQGFVLKGSDFSMPVGDNPYCEGNFQDARASQPGARPFLWMDRPGHGPQIVGISGSARIDDVGRAGDCSFLKKDRNFPLKVDCELRDYVVQLEVRLGVSKADTSHRRVVGQQTLKVVSQRIPGLRLVVHCAKERTDIGGCA
jgi:hypothetical protein